MLPECEPHLIREKRVGVQSFVVFPIFSAGDYYTCAMTALKYTCACRFDANVYVRNVCAGEGHPWRRSVLFHHDNKI